MLWADSRTGICDLLCSSVSGWAAKGQGGDGRALHTSGCQALLHLQNWSADAAQDRKLHPESPTPLLIALQSNTHQIQIHIFNIQRGNEFPCLVCPSGLASCHNQFIWQIFLPYKTRGEIVLPQFWFPSWNHRQSGRARIFVIPSFFSPSLQVGVCTRAVCGDESALNPSWKLSSLVG